MVRLKKEVRKAIGPAVEKSGDEFVMMARRLAPVDDGDLRGSIRAEDKTDLGITIKAGGQATTRKTGRYEYDYALGIEFGTRKSEARPFFYPAYRLVKKRITGRIRRGVAKSVRETFNGN